MQSIQTGHTVSLSQVKPLSGLLQFRKFCLESVKKALSGKTRQREKSPIDQTPLVSWGTVEGLDYLSCPKTGSLFLAQVPSIPVWGEVLQEVCAHRHSPENFHEAIRKSRRENVFEPKLNWIQNTIRLRELEKPSLLEVATPPSDFTDLLKSSKLFSNIKTATETETLLRPSPEKSDAAVLLECLDRVTDPAALLQNVHASLKNKGLIFITALVSSGFDTSILKTKNAYLFPPDRTNCFSLIGLKQLVTSKGFRLLEVSTPGVLDVGVVQAHLNQKTALTLSDFERQILESDEEVKAAFQNFLQQCNLSSFARLVGQKQEGS